MKQHLFYTFLGIFIATAVVTLLGITKVISIDDKYLTPLFSALLIELIGAVIAMYRGVNFFEETEGSPVGVNQPVKTPVLFHNAPTLSSKISSNNQNHQALDLEEYFTRLDNLSERHRERTTLKNETNGKLVHFTGIVTRVSDSESGHKITTKSKSGKTVFIDLPASKEADVYCLRTDDIVNVYGTIDTQLESSTSISSEEFERIEDDSSNKSIRPNTNALTD
jgi:hypothetical protein